MNQRRILWLVIGMICGAVISNHPLISRFFDTTWVVSHSVSSDEKTQSVRTIDTVYRILQDEYYDSGKVLLSWMREWWIKWFVDALKDPYTEYFSIEQNKTFEAQLEWQEEFEGIGAAVQKKDEYIQIQEVFKGTPAAIAGLRPLDAIVEIDGEKTKDLSVAEAVKKIRWPKWTTVKLLIFRISEKDPTKRAFTVDVTRQNVKIPSVNVNVIKSGNKNIAYIEIALIGDQTENFLKEWIKSLSGSRIDGVILDLRGNGGWYLPKSVEIASHFIPKWKTIVTGRYSILPTEKFVSKWYGDFEWKPIVVLVDALTASAWEIIAWALRQNVQATLIGATTYGKWSIQTIAEIGSGAWLKYTIGKRYLPDDTNIDHEWIKPDIEVLFDREQYEKNQIDVQKNRAIEEVVKLIK